MSRFGNSQEGAKRARASRVEITHTLYLPDGTQVQENLPLVIGVIANLSGDVEPDRPDLKDNARDFRHVHKDNFDEVLAGAKPHLKFTLPSLEPGGELFQVDLHFRRIQDFHPDQVVKKIPKLNEQLERRKRLQNLLNMLGSDPKLEARLQEIVDDPAKRSDFLTKMASRDSGGDTR